MEMFTKSVSLSLHFSLLILFLENVDTSPTGDFNAYLKLFSNCLIHLINYPEVDLGSLESPVVLSRYFLNPKAIIGETAYFTRDEFKDLGLNKTTNRDSDDELNKLGLMRSSYYNWVCRVQVYIYPPEFYVHKNMEFLEFRIPWAFMNFWNTQTSSVREPGLFSSLVGNYHVLVQKEGFNNFGWIKEMNSVRSRQPQARFMVLSTRNTNEEMGSMGMLGNEEITWADIVCQYCFQWAQTFIPLKGPLTRESLDVQLIAASEENNGVPWMAYDLNLELHGLTLYVQAFMVKGVQERKLNFRNLQDYSQRNALLFDQWNLRLPEDTPDWCLADRTSVENVLLALAVPNITIGDADWCSYGPFCYRNPADTPSVQLNVGVSSRAFLPSPEEPLAFFTCGWQTNQGMQFRAFVSSYDLFTWITVFWFYILLCVLIGVLHQRWNEKSLFTFGNMAFMGFKVLLEQGDDVAGNKKKVRFMYWISGSFLLAGVVLSNGYRGANITDLTSPIPPLGLQNLSQLVELGFKIYTSRGLTSERTVNTANLSEILEYLKNGNNTADQLPGPVGDYQHFIFYNIMSIRSQLSEDLFKFFAHILYPRVAELQSSDLFPGWPNDPISNDLKWHIRNSTLFRSCNKTAFVGWWDLVEDVAKRLSFVAPGLISLVKDKHIKRQTGWDIVGWEDERIIRRLAQLVESGVADKWRELDKRGVCGSLSLKFQYANFKAKERIKKYARPLSLLDNIHAVFVMVAGGLCLCLSCFVVEIRHWIWWTLMDLFYVMKNMIKQGLIKEQVIKCNNYLHRSIKRGSEDRYN